MITSLRTKVHHIVKNQQYTFLFCFPNSNILIHTTTCTRLTKKKQLVQVKALGRVMRKDGKQKKFLDLVMTRKITIPLLLNL